jgi:copper chaperone CopZ
MSKVTYQVPNIHCGHCLHTIQMEIGEIEGVESVHAAVDTRQVDIVFGEPATEEILKATLAQINYPVAGLISL